MDGRTRSPQDSINLTIEGPWLPRYRVEEVRQRRRVTPKLVRDTIDERSGLLEHAALDTRAVGSATCSTSTATGESKRPSPRKGLHLGISDWLRRAEAARLPNQLGLVPNEIQVPHPACSREWPRVALVECGSCHQVAEILLGPVYFRLLFGGELTPALAEQVVSAFLAAYSDSTG